MLPRLGRSRHPQAGPLALPLNFLVGRSRYHPPGRPQSDLIRQVGASLHQHLKLAFLVGSLENMQTFADVSFEQRQPGQHVFRRSRTTETSELRGSPVTRLLLQRITHKPGSVAMESRRPACAVSFPGLGLGDLRRSMPPKNCMDFGRIVEKQDRPDMGKDAIATQAKGIVGVRDTQTANDMPVLPLVASTITSPEWRSPCASKPCGAYGQRLGPAQGSLWQ